MKRAVKKKYAISLGLDCAMSGNLVETGVRVFSTPFDWLDGADIYTRLNLIRSGFKDFFNKEDFKEYTIPSDPPNRAHKRFSNVRTHLNFSHDFSTTQSFEQSFPENYEKYKRRINHLYIVIETKDFVFFVLDRNSLINEDDLQKVLDEMKVPVVLIQNDINFL